MSVQVTPDGNDPVKLVRRIMAENIRSAFEESAEASQELKYLESLSPPPDRSRLEEAREAYLRAYSKWYAMDDLRDHVDHALRVNGLIA